MYAETKVPFTFTVTEPDVPPTLRVSVIPNPVPLGGEAIVQVAGPVGRKVAILLPDNTQTRWYELIDGAVDIPIFVPSTSVAGDTYEWTVLFPRQP